MTKISIAALAVLAVATVGCNMLPAFDSAASPGPTVAAGDREIANTDWLLSTLVDTPLVSGTEITIQFALLQAAGFGGCNQYNATYSTDGSSTLTFGPIASTRMACAGGAGTFETAYFAALGRVRTYNIEGTQLTLSGEGGAALLTYAAAAPGSIVGPWLATSVNNGSGGVTSVPAGVTGAVSFLEDGSVQGFGGCNDFSGTYTLDGQSIVIGPLMATRMACADEATNTFEAQFLTALQISTAWAVSGSTLELRDGDGSLQVQADSAIGR